MLLSRWCRFAFPRETPAQFRDDATPSLIDFVFRQMQVYLRGGDHAYRAGIEPLAVDELRHAAYLLDTNSLPFLPLFSPIDTIALGYFLALSWEVFSD